MVQPRRRSLRATGSIATTLVALALLCTGVASVAADGTPPAADDSPVATADRDHLSRLLGAIAAIEGEISDITEALQTPEGQARADQLRRRLQTRTEELERLDSQFSEIASGVALPDAEPEDAGAMDWSAELQDLLGPALAEIKRATTRPREIDRLSRAIDRDQLRLDQVRSARANVAASLAEEKDARIVERLRKLESGWRADEERLTTEIGLARKKLAGLRSERRSISETVSDLFQLFFKSRGRSLVAALAAMLLCIVVLRLLFGAIKRLKPFRTKQRTGALRMVEFGFGAFLFVAAVTTFLLVLYSIGDWVLLTIASLFLLGLAWASKTHLPRFWRQAMLLMNLGSVREGERLVFGGVPYRVDSVGFYTYLSNPDLDAGRLRIPIETLHGMHSRPYDEDEPWFPSRSGDWVVIDDGPHARVVSQSPDLVALVFLGGARQTFPTAEFLQRNPRVLSAGFRLGVPFGIDYGHQSIVTTDVPAILQQDLEKALRASRFAKHVRNVEVDFKEAGPSSLDVVALVDVGGGAGADYLRLQRFVQRTFVNTCNARGWVIPFTQITLHTAREPEEPGPR